MRADAGPSKSSTAAVCVLLVAGALTGVALAAPGSASGVRASGAATPAVRSGTVDPARGFTLVTGDGVRLDGRFQASAEPKPKAKRKAKAKRNAKVKANAKAKEVSGG